MCPVCVPIYYVSQYTVCVYTDLGATIIRARKSMCPNILYVSHMCPNLLYGPICVPVYCVYTRTLELRSYEPEKRKSPQSEYLTADTCVHPPPPTHPHPHTHTHPHTPTHPHAAHMVTDTNTFKIHKASCLNSKP